MFYYNNSVHFEGNFYLPPAEFDFQTGSVIYADAEQRVQMLLEN